MINTPLFSTKVYHNVLKYITPQIVLYREKAVLRCEPEMPMIHCCLSKIPDDLPFEYLIRYAGDLSIQYPPGDLAEEAKQHYEKYVKFFLNAYSRSRHWRPVLGKTHLALSQQCRSY